MELLRNFKNLGKNDVAIAGGKGASLGEMTRLGVSVPSGFVILSSAFDRFIEEAELTAEIDAAIDLVDHRKIHTAENASEKIRSLILAAEIPKDIAVEIKAAFKNLGAKNVAVRSSATTEDSSSAAWAGQLESYLNTTEKNLFDNVKRCWASLFTPRAIFYRFEKKLHKQKIGVAVVVQKMIASEISGVAFSVHPITQDRNQIIIEASYGLGEAIVSGEVTPDSYVIEKEPRQIIDRVIQDKRNGAVLSDRQILGLSALVLHIEKHCGFPCDIEWAIKNGKFYILQSRPITTLTSGIKKINAPKKKVFITYENPIYPYFYSPTMYAAVPKYKGRQLMGDWYAKFRYKKTSIIKAPENAFEEYGDFYLNLILKRNKAFCDHLFSLGKKIVALGEKLQARNYDDLKLGKVSNIGAFYKEYRNLFGEVLGFGYSLDYAFDNYIKENNIDLHSIAASYPSFIQLEKYELKKIFQNKKGVALNKAIHEHVLRYSWLQNDYSGEYRISIEDIAARRAETLNEKSSVRPRKIAKPKNVKEWISFLTFIRDERKKCNLIATGLLDRYLKKECLARGIDYARAVMLTVDEFEKSKNRNIKNYKGVRTVHIAKDGVDDLSQKVWDTAVDEGKWIGDKNEFSGISAMSGIVVGVAKVILQRSDFPKLKQGEIIVASMTRPEFSPILGKCSGIITNEGGVTSHAAIIARELKKPCVIGTSIATKLIHDGDTVRVNGDNGTITILKKANP